MEVQLEYVHFAYTFLHVLASTCNAQSMLNNTISASELSRKFTKSALLVGKETLSSFSFSVGSKSQGWNGRDRKEGGK